MEDARPASGKKARGSPALTGWESSWTPTLIKLDSHAVGMKFSYATGIKDHS